MKLKSDTFYNYFLISFIYVKISKNLSAKYYQENKKRLQKKTRGIYQHFSREEKERNDNMVESVTKIYQKMKKKPANYRKKYYSMRKNV